MRLIAFLLSLTLWSTLAAETVLSVDSVRAMATDHSYALRRNKNDERKADLDLQIAKRQRLPDIDGSAMGLVAKDMEIMEGTTLQMRGMYNAGLNLTLPLYAGGQISAGIRLAKIGREVARLNTIKSRAEVIADADNNYYTLVAVREKVKLLEAYRNRMTALIGQVERSQKAGLATNEDLLRLEAKRSEIEYQLQKARTGEDLCRMSLCNAVGLPLDTHVVPADSLMISDIPGILDTDISERPEVGLLRQQVEASKAQVKMARAAYLPTVALAGGIFWYGNVKMKGTTALPDGTPYQYTHKFDGYMPIAMLSVSIPLIHWGKEFKKVKKAKLDLENSRLMLEDNVRLMGIEARKAVKSLEDGVVLVESSRKGLASAEKSREVMKRKFDNGLATLTDMLDAEAQWQQAYSNHIEALAQQKINYTDYLRVTGRL